MKFWIVTPSYNHLDYLKLAIMSVADQTRSNIQVHHHIQDGNSSDGTYEYLKKYAENIKDSSKKNYTFSFESKKDEGMYDAINRGWKLAPTDIDVIAHLNSDEQYISDGLDLVAQFLKNSKDVEILLMDMFVIGENGDYVCHRRSLKPNSLFAKYACAGFTAATFQRVSITKEKRIFFNTKWKNFGDKVWYNDLIKNGVRFGVLNQPIAIFAETGENLNWTDEGLRERDLYCKEFLNNSKFGTKVIAIINAVIRRIKEVFLTSPKQFDFYPYGHNKRIKKIIKNPTCHWGKSWKNVNN